MRKHTNERWQGERSGHESARSEPRDVPTRSSEEVEASWADNVDTLLAEDETDEES